MIIRKLTIFLFLLLTLGQVNAQTPQQELQVTAQLLQTKYRTVQSKYEIYQMAGNAQGMQLCQMEAQCHQQMYNYLQQLANNPSYIQSPQGRQEYYNAVWEWDYRTKYQDYRSAQEIAPSLQQYIAQRRWEVTTPQGQAAWQNQQNQRQQAFQAHQNQHQQNNAAFDSYMNSLRSASNQDDKYHRQYVNTIHDNYEYVNPSSGQSYVMPNVFNSAPMMQNPDGSYTQMVPYQNY